MTHLFSPLTIPQLPSSSLYLLCAYTHQFLLLFLKHLFSLGTSSFSAVLFPPHGLGCDPLLLPLPSSCLCHPLGCPFLPSHVIFPSLTSGGLSGHFFQLLRSQQSRPESRGAHFYPALVSLLQSMLFTGMAFLGCFHLVFHISWGAVSTETKLTSQVCWCLGAAPYLWVKDPKSLFFSTDSRCFDTLGEQIQTVHPGML